MDANVVCKSVPIIRDVTIWPRLVPSCKANMLNLKYRSTTFNSQLEVAAFLFDQEFNTIAGEYPVPVKHFRLIFISAWTRKPTNKRWRFLLSPFIYCDDPQLEAIPVSTLCTRGITYVLSFGIAP